MCNVPEPAECVLTDDTVSKLFDVKTHKASDIGSDRIRFVNR